MEVTSTTSSTDQVSDTWHNNNSITSTTSGRVETSDRCALYCTRQRGRPTTSALQLMRNNTRCIIENLQTVIKLFKVCRQKYEKFRIINLYSYKFRSKMLIHFWETITGCFKIIAPPNCFGIFSLQLSLKWRHFRKDGTLHFLGEYSKLDRVKTMGTGGKINAIWWNIKINLKKLVHIICRCELPTSLGNFTQKDLTKVKICQNV